MNTIIFITGLFPPEHCGIGDFTARLSEEVAKQGAQTWVVTHKTSSGASQEHVLRVVDQWNFSAWKTLREALKNFDKKSTVIDIQYPSPVFGKNLFVNLLPWLLRFHGYRVAVTAHEYSTFSFKGKVRVLFTLAAAHKKIVVSETEKKKLPKFFQKRVFVIPIGNNIPVHPRNENAINDLRTKFGIAPSDAVLLFFGNIQPQKGFLELLHAFLKVRNSLPNTKLLLIGSRAKDATGSFDPSYQQSLDPYFEEAAAFIQEHDLQRSILETGYVEKNDLSQYFYLGTLGVFPFTDGASWRRGSLLASLAHEVPTITTLDVKNTPDTMKSIALTPVGDEKALSRTIISYLSGEADIEELKRSAKELVRYIEWEKVAKQTIEVLGK
jgi:glycosyltransferase involved in cell wall biosynthesis